MDQSSLFALLNIAPSKASPVKVLPTGKVPERVPGFLSETALELDRWDIERGALCLKNSPRAQSAKLSPSEMADFHALAFDGDPTLVEDCVDTRRLEYVRTLLESPDLQSLRASTVHNTLTSEMAATELGTAWASLKAQDKGRESLPGKNEKAQAKKAREAQSALLKATFLGIGKALNEVEELEEMGDALGMSPGSGQGGNNLLDANRIKSAFQRVKDNGQLRRIIDGAGRFIRVASAKQRRKQLHGYDDVTGVIPGGDIGRLTTTELAYLSDEEELGDDAMRRLVERQALSREHRGVEKLGKGPVIICVDESSSMAGPPIETAKSFALAMYWIARHQKRWCALVGFSGGTQGTLCVLPYGKANEGQLMDWLLHNYAGGTSPHVVCERVPGDYWQKMESQGLPKGKTDLIVVSDGEIEVSTEMSTRFNKWKETSKCRALGLMIGFESSGGGWKSILDEVYSDRDIGIGGDGVGAALSI